MMFGIVMIVFGCLCMGYYLFAASYAGPTSSFLPFWLAAGIFLIVAGVVFLILLKNGTIERIPKFIRVTFITLVTIGIGLFCVLEGLVISKMNEVPEHNVSYLVVLGAQVRGTRVTKSLAKRLDAAYDYAVKNKDTIIVVSGGKGSGEDISEAKAMKRYLVSRGIEKRRILVEDKSTTTMENLTFSRKKIKGENKSVAIVTNNFHMFRAMKIAESLDYKNVEGLCAESDNRLLPNYMVREAFAIAKEMLVHNIL